MSNVRNVRDELIGVLYRVGVQQNMTAADAILEQFDVTPKPVISDEELGRMATVVVGVNGADVAWVGGSIRKSLDVAGLEIVRKEAGE